MNKYHFQLSIDAIKKTQLSICRTHQLAGTRPDFFPLRLHSASRVTEKKENEKFKFFKES